VALEGRGLVISSKFEQAAWLVAEIDHRRDHWTACRHPFYERWSAGELTGDELRTYAGEHHHVAAVLADVAHRAAALADGLLHEELTRHADERECELELWCSFAAATGWGPSTAWFYAGDPLPETEASAALWLGGEERSLCEHVVTLYALETAQADVARLQLDALLGRYGFTGGRSTRYFELRLRGDGGPAGLLEAALTGLLPVADPFVLLRRAERSYRAYWELLDGVARAVGTPS
jgi:pyrroloquinoline-quinone synthase